ncbi:MAG TPA: sulfatase-like hydrolase/transferase [Phycisphaerae bacterium]|nr:sulfatase-like hydrolase/transferase [Phycisphaerae bacterium]HNU46237.1 sulfatase-like hydrolase/transferase [Phycisphaerae bacterium]
MSPKQPWGKASLWLLVCAIAGGRVPAGGPEKQATSSEAGPLARGAAAATSTSHRDAEHSAVEVHRHRPRLPTQPNIIYIMTDDQRWDTLAGVAPQYMPQEVMPNVEAHLLTSGILFAQTFVTSPICAPSRASILSGGFYARHTGVLTNELPCGGATRFHDNRSLATLLQDRGYRTAFLGKYINDSARITGYNPSGQYISGRHYVPPGWSTWMQCWNSNYLGQELTIGSSSTAGPERGLLTPLDIMLPRPFSGLEEFLAVQEAQGFPPSVSSVVRGLYTCAGDYTHSGSIDKDDFKYAVPCLSGPGVPCGPDCSFFDLDSDGDVDLVDVAKLQRAVGVMPYLTHLQEDLSLAYLEDAALRQVPFFLFLAPYAPHDPATPAPEDAQLFPGFEYRGRAWGEEDVSDKPWHLRNYVEPTFSRYYTGHFPYASGNRSPDQFFADMLRCLRAVDRMVGSICTTLDQDPWLRDNTVVIFTSDNGEMWGEHKRFSKCWPYEESIRVPLVIRMPGADPGTRNQLVAADLDVPATILHLAGYTKEEITETPLSNGSSLVEVIEDAQAPWRDSLLLEFYRLDKPTLATSWGAIRQQGWKYVLYDYLWNGVWVDELYDLQTDPYELQSQHANPAFGEVKADLGALLAEERGLTMVGFVHPWGSPAPAQRGNPYTFQVQAVGGTPPYHWGEYPGNHDSQWTGLPAGLSVGADGCISGVPASSGVFYFDVRVEDSSVSPQHGGPQEHIARFELVVNP